MTIVLKRSNGLGVTDAVDLPLFGKDEIQQGRMILKY